MTTTRSSPTTMSTRLLLLGSKRILSVSKRSIILVLDFIHENDRVLKEENRAGNTPHDASEGTDLLGWYSVDTVTNIQTSASRRCFSFFAERERLAGGASVEESSRRGQTLQLLPDVRKMTELANTSGGPFFERRGKQIT